MTVAEQIARIRSLRDAIAERILAKGGDVPTDAVLADLPDAVDSIPAGVSSPVVKYICHVDSPDDGSIEWDDGIAEPFETYFNNAYYPTIKPRGNTLKITGDWDHWSDAMTSDTSSSWARYRRQSIDSWTAIRKGQAIELTDGMEVIIHAGTCLAWDTMILMADGSTKKIIDIEVGDMVATPKGPDKVVYADGKEFKKHSESDIWTFEDGTVIRTVHRHRFFNKEDQCCQYMDKWKAGEHAKKSDGTYPKLVSHANIKGEIQHCTIFTEQFNLYYANGLLSGNRMSNYWEEDP